MSLKTQLVCDSCELLSETDTPEYGGLARLPGGWVRASLDGTVRAHLDLCDSCYLKLSLKDVDAVYRRNKREMERLK